MTSNQIKYAEVNEGKRANRARETELNRSNRANERNVRRANRETARSNKAREAETVRSNKAREAEERRKTNVSGIGQIGGIATRIAGLFANDPAWTNLDPQAVSDVASLSFNTPVGTRIPKLSTETGDYEVVPGIMRVNYAPGIGVTQFADPYSAGNAAFRSVYSYVRSGNSGAKNYEANDLGMYLLAMDSIYQFIQYCVRAYGILMYAESTNRYTGLAIVKSMGFQQDVINNPNAFRTMINMWIAQLKVISVPKVFPLYERHIWLCSHVFRDMDSAKSQFYYYSPDYLFRFSFSSGIGGSGELVPVQIPSTWNMSTLKTFWDQLWIPIISDEDIAIMSGDILKKYEENGLYTLHEVDVGFRIEPRYDEDALQQLHNTRLMGAPYLNFNHIYQTPSDGGLWWGSPSYYQDATQAKITYIGGDVTYPDSNLYWAKFPGVAPSFNSSATGRFGCSTTSADISQYDGPRLQQALFNLYTSRREPEWIMEYTRNVAFVKDAIGTTLKTPEESSSASGDPAVIQFIDTCGCEYFTTAQIYKFKATQGSLSFNDMQVLSFNGQYSTLIDGIPVSWSPLATATYDFLSSYTSFDWAPIWHLCATNNSGASLANYSCYSLGRVGDLQTYLILDAELMSKMHYVAMQSYLGIPNMGKPW